MTVVLITTATSPWNRPGDWTDAGHKVELLGCGGNGGLGNTGASNLGGAGGAGGGYYGLVYSSGALGATTAFEVNTSNSSTTDADTNATNWEATTNANSYEAKCGLAGVAAAGGTGAATGGSGGTPVYRCLPSCLPPSDGSPRRRAARIVGLQPLLGVPSAL
jgi:hypothetical protein